MATPSKNLAFQNFYQAQLTSDITASDTNIPVDTVPTGSEGFLVIDPDSSSSREVIFFDSKTSTQVVCPSAAEGRGQDGTTASAHLSGTTVIMAPVAAMFEALQSGDALADDSVTATKTDFGGSGSGIWWEEIGRDTLAVAGDTLTVSGLTAKKYLKIIVNLVPSGAIGLGMTFNNDSTANYTRRVSGDGATDTTNTNETSLRFYVTNNANPTYMVSEILNIATQEKLALFSVVERGTAGAGNAPNRSEGAGKWANTSDQITRVDVSNLSTGDFGIGSEIIVLGHD